MIEIAGILLLIVFAPLLLGIAEILIGLLWVIFFSSREPQ